MGFAFRLALLGSLLAVACVPAGEVQDFATLEPRVAELAKELGDKNFRVRREATRTLLSMASEPGKWVKPEEVDALLDRVAAEPRSYARPWRKAPCRWP